MDWTTKLNAHEYIPECFTIAGIWFGRKCTVHSDKYNYNPVNTWSMSIIKHILDPFSTQPQFKYCINTNTSNLLMTAHACKQKYFLLGHNICDQLSKNWLFSHIPQIPFYYISVIYSNKRVSSKNFSLL